MRACARGRAGVVGGSGLAGVSSRWRRGGRELRLQPSRRSLRPALLPCLPVGRAVLPLRPSAVVSTEWGGSGPSRTGTGTAAPASPLPSPPRSALPCSGAALSRDPLGSSGLTAGTRPAGAWARRRREKAPESATRAGWAGCGNREAPCWGRGPRSEDISWGVRWRDERWYQRALKVCTRETSVRSFLFGYFDDSPFLAWKAGGSWEAALRRETCMTNSVSYVICNSKLNRHSIVEGCIWLFIIHALQAGWQSGAFW